MENVLSQVGISNFAFTMEGKSYEVRKDDKYGLYIRKINFMEYRTWFADRNMKAPCRCYSCRKKKH